MKLEVGEGNVRTRVEMNALTRHYPTAIPGSLPCTRCKSTARHSQPSGQCRQYIFPYIHTYTIPLYIYS